MEAKIVIVTGPVGVGKSTVIRALTYLLRTEGYKSASIFVKAFHGPSYLLWIIAEHIVMSKRKRRIAPWLTLSKVAPALARLLTMLSIYLDIIYISLIILRVMLMKIFGITVFIEEYLSSTSLDYIYSFYRIKIYGSMYHAFPIRVIMSLCTKHKPDLVVLLDADIYEIKRHWHIRGYGDTQMNYVLFQKQFLPKLVHVFYENRVIEFNVALTSAIEIAKRMVKIIKTNTTTGGL